MFAFSPDNIETDKLNSYTTTFEVLEDKSVHFTTFRDLESFEGNFVIPLDQTINMVGAYSNS